MVKNEEILRFEQIMEKSGNNPQTGWNSGKKIIISLLRRKTTNLSRNMVKTVEIWRFEKCLQEKLRKKKN